MQRTTDSVPVEPPFDFAEIRRRAYELLANLEMYFENGKAHEGFCYKRPYHPLYLLSELVGADDQLSVNPFGDGRMFERPKLPLTEGVFSIAPETGEGIIVQAPASAGDIRVRASRLASDRDAFALQRLWEVAISLQSYYGFFPSILSPQTDLNSEQNNPSRRYEPIPSDIFPQLDEAIRLLDEQRPVTAKADLETWLTILSDLDEKFPNFRPTIEFDPGPCISDRLHTIRHVQGGIGNSSPPKETWVEAEETRPFTPLRRLAKSLVPLLESVGVSLPDDAGSNAHGRLLFWAWHIHTGTTPSLPSWEVIPELGAFKLIKSAIVMSVNPDGSAKLSSLVSLNQEIDSRCVKF